MRYLPASAFSILWIKHNFTIMLIDHPSSLQLFTEHWTNGLMIIVELLDCWRSTRVTDILNGLL